jgi:hypothetical protein
MYYVPRCRDDLRICNCASCGEELLGDSMIGWYNDAKPGVKRLYGCPEPIEARIKDRPYCKKCIEGVKEELRKKELKDSIQRGISWSPFM